MRFSRVLITFGLLLRMSLTANGCKSSFPGLKRSFEDCMKPLPSCVVQSPTHVIDYVIEDSNWFKNVKENVCKNEMNTPECWISSLVFLVDPQSPIYHFASKCICEYAESCTGLKANGFKEVLFDRAYLDSQCQLSEKREFTATTSAFSSCVAQEVMISRLKMESSKKTVVDSISKFLYNHYTYCRSNLVMSYSYKQRLIFQVLYLNWACPRQNSGDHWRENILEVYEDATRKDSSLWEAISTCRGNMYPCVPNPCQNGGTCKPAPDGAAAGWEAQCTCQSSRGGKFCEIKTSPGGVEKYCLQIKSTDASREADDPNWLKKFVDGLASELKLIWSPFLGFMKVEVGAKYTNKSDDKIQATLTATVWVSLDARDGGADISDLVEHFDRSSAIKTSFSGGPTPCEKEYIDGCQQKFDKTCGQYASCTLSASGDYVCICDSGYEGNGFDCTQASVSDPCLSNPCKNDGICTSLAEKFSCQCKIGYRGGDCRIVPRCPGNKVYTTCASKCRDFCEMKKDFCSFGCDPEVFCVCPTEMVERSEGSNRCVLKEDCPVKRSKRAICRAWGDRHYTTFDGNKIYNFTGMCSYTMSETSTIPVTDTRWFKIVARNEFADGVVNASFAKELVIFLNGGNTTIRLQKQGYVLVDGIPVMEANSPFFRITRPGRNVVVTTLHDVSISFNGRSIHVKVPESFMNTLRGLCSNYNGNPNDELTMNNGTVAVHYGEFAQSYQHDDCNIPLPPPVACTANDRIKWSSDEHCGMFLNLQNAFSDCYALVDRRMYFDSCVSDACTTGNFAALEQNLEQYVVDCKDNGIDICNWRQLAGMKYSRCPDHSSYDGCASPCQDTCFDPDASKKCEDDTTVEMCVCESGYVRDGTRCVERIECGCAKDFLYYAKGQGYESDSDVCVCREQNSFDCMCKTGYEYDGTSCKKKLSTACDSNPCKNGGVCMVSGNSYSCRCQGGFKGRKCQRAPRCPGNKIYTECGPSCVDSCDQQFTDCAPGCNPDKYCECPPGMIERTRGSNRCILPERCPKKRERSRLVVCQAWGDPHYQLFDGGLRYEFMGECKYMLSETVGIPKNNSRWFMVVAENERRYNATDVSWLQMVTITLDSGSTVITIGKDGVGAMNGNKIIEYNNNNNGIKVSRIGRGVTVTTKHGVSISFNADAVRIKVPETYKHELAGLCGNYNDDPDDDLMMEDGNMASNFSEFAASYQYGECENPFVPTSVCSEQNKTKWSDSEYCGMLLDPAGAFGDCRFAENPQMYFDACVVDMCATDGKMEVMESTFAVYVTACKDHGVNLCNWRTEAGVRQLNCPEFSSYDGCASVCQNTCLNPRGSESCNDDGTRVEDCVCDPGYIREGGKCVQRGECGCADNGIYYRLGQSIRFNQASCECTAVNSLNCSCQIGYHLVGKTCVETILVGHCGMKRSEITASSTQEYVPVCDAVGNYQNKQCKSGTCYCVDEFTGVKIEGTDRTSMEAFTLDCDRLPDTCRYVRAAAIASQKFNDFIPVCDDDENYVPEQCVAATGTCFCVDTITGEIDGGSRRPIGDTPVKCNPEPGSVRDTGMIAQHCLQIRSVDSPEDVDNPNWFNVFVSQLTSNLKTIWETFPGFMRAEFGAQFQMKQNGTAQATISANVWLDLLKTRKRRAGAKHLIRHFSNSSPEIKSQFEGKPVECSKDFKQKSPCQQRFDRKCSRHAICLMDPDGEYSCVCADGYSGDGLKCKRARDRLATCRIWGDPHYSTFDEGEVYDFMGLCTYVISEALVEQTDERWFRIVAENEIRENITSVSYVKSTTLYLRGEDYVIAIEKDGTVTVNGNKVVEAETPMYKIERSGRGPTVTTVSGVSVYFNGDALRVRLPGSYKNQVKGVCGNNNGIPEDDLVMENGKIAKDFNTFASSHLVGECDKPVPPPVQCSEADKMKWSGNSYCGQLINDTAAFRACRGVVDSQIYFESCVFDLCATDGNMKMFLNVLEEYVARCQFNGIDLCGWRQNTGVKPISCPDHSTYSGCATACQDTCFRPSASADCEETSTTEACVCEEGYILNGDKCVPLSECGCVRDSSYYNRGEVVYYDSQVCTCEGRNDFECKCKPGFYIVDRDCKLMYPKESCGFRRAELMAVGDPNTFIPECDLQGDYVGKQCYLFTGQCSCVHKKTGRALKETTTDSAEFTLDCDKLPDNCLFRNAVREAEGIESEFVPACDEDGGYETERCDDEMCICVDRVTGDEVNGTKAKLNDFNTDCDNLPPNYGRCVIQHGRECNEHATCSTVPEGYQCVCNHGYSGDGYTCVGQDECEITFLKKCHQNAECKENSGGNFTCVCKTGFVGDGFDCQDTEKKCREKVGQRCHRHATCVAVGNGTYACRCKEGFVGNGLRCNEISPCHKLLGAPCQENARCKKSSGIYRCKCNSGYREDGSACVQMDRCEKRFGRLCHVHADCGKEEDADSYSCRCRDGYTGDGLECQEMSACHKLFKQPCDANATCLLIRATHRCDCLDGYKGDGFSCKKMSPCESKLGTPCHSDAECMMNDKLGVYECRCKNTHWGDGNFCGSGDPPTDLCHRRFGRQCHFDAACVEVSNKIHKCRCLEGKIGDGFECQEMDRRLCFMDLGQPCNENAFCMKDGENYTCRCRSKYFGDGFYCDNGEWADECHKNFGRRCSNHARCDGGEDEKYLCRCSTEYTGDGFSCQPRPTQPSQKGQTDRNKLRAKYPCYFQLGHFCHQYATCSMTNDGQYECSCWRGFSGDGMHCLYQPHDGCQQVYGRACHKNAKCSVHRSGQYQCRCEMGYIGNGFFCRADPKNRCEARFGRRCHSNAKCQTRGDKAYQCVCSRGYSGDGFNCQLQSECYRRHGLECHPLADCKETADNSYTCQCGRDYIGDGFNCRERSECHKQSGKDCHQEAFFFDTGDGYRCQCRDGYEGNGVTACKEVFCQRPTDINQGTVSPDLKMYRVGQLITYGCRPGQRLAGDSTRKCMSNSEWDGKEPTCSKSQPGQYQDACHKRYDLPCSPNGVCKQIDGIYVCSCKNDYVGDGFQCQGIEDRDKCVNQLGQACHKFAECQINSLGEHNCHCRKGYRGNGTECEGPCQRPRGIVNGLVIGTKYSYNINEIVTYKCISGFQLEGNMKRACLPDSNWIGDEPSCTKLMDKCFARYSYFCHHKADCINTKEGYICVCIKGYAGDGIDCRRLNNDKAIDETLKPGDKVRSQTCQDYFNQPCNMFAECQYLGGASFQCVCKKGFAGNGFDCSREMKVRCQRPNDIPHGRVAASNKRYFVNTVVTYSCASGYELMGEPEITCAVDGMWSGFAPSCEKQEIRLLGTRDDNGDPPPESRRTNARPEDCEKQLGKPCHHFADCRREKNDRFQCWCRQGYDGNGFDCEDAHQQIARCNRPQDIAFGSIRPNGITYMMGSSVTYSCRRGYQLTGETKRTCQDDGRWSGEQPTCERKSASSRPCQQPQSLQDGRVIPSDRRYRDQSSVKYRCKKGFWLEGDEKRICQNGKWSGIHPRCIRI